MGAAEFLDWSVQIALVILSVAFLGTVIKVIRGPTLPDRILALDMLVATAIGFIAAIGIKTGFTLYVDIAITLGLVGFLATVAFARFVLARGRSENDAPAEDEDITEDAVIMPDAAQFSGAHGAKKK
ncbi:MAG: cation:proton antiporter [Roseitalea sp.]|jgi:multicomponent Na+:H+ antiporter subunit F|nr:cation:proton antiporter [Roseitalea sp.]MBO6720504.1 cation:proton antiporter [Roseitalea sp.]MBO6743651.1 cation:proton antiporter [Roseitalea sp.]